LVTTRQHVPTGSDGAGPDRRATGWLAGLHPIAGLAAYFRSGWAFLVPYQLAYLLCAWRHWPATSAAAHPGAAAPVSLLQIYWFLHVVHLVLLAAAMWSAVRPASFMLALRRSAPWLLLGAVIAIPGIYLEWPADTWEHLRRIAECQFQADVAEHSAGYKSAYFFEYSWVALASPRLLLPAAGAYYAGVGLLLAWQYYRLGEALGWERPWALVGVAMAIVVFGNSCFSFLRYYGLASTIYAQIAALALIRLAILLVRREGAAGYAPADPSRGRRAVTRLLALGTAVGGLLLVISGSHRQALGIAAFGGASVFAGALLHHWRRATPWLVVALLGLNVVVLYCWNAGPTAGAALYWRAVSADEFRRGLSQVVGTIGWLNLAAGCWLVLRGNLCGYLTVGPMLLLVMPATFLPVSQLVARNGASITYARMLFAIPAGFALIETVRTARAPAWSGKWIAAAGALILPIALVGLTLPGPSAPAFGRLWNALAQTPADLRLSGVLAATDAVQQHPDARPVASDTVAATFQTVAAIPFENRYRPIGQPITPSIAHVIGATRFWGPAQPAEPTTPGATAPAAMSGAWTTVSGAACQFVHVPEADGAPAPIALQNPAGDTSEVLTTELIPVDPRKIYRVEMSVRLASGPAAPVYLAVAWFDTGGRLLPANVGAPAGANWPTGWRNGTYSYFGLVAQTPPARWTTYRRSFGPGEAAEIPPQAAFVRLGALLNYPAAVQGAARLANVRLWPKSPAELQSDGHFSAGEARLLVVPDWHSLISPVSIAGLASQHWPRSEVAADLAGTAEMSQAAATAGAERLGHTPALYLLRATDGQRTPR
jgi:hypothetical protein